MLAQALKYNAEEAKQPQRNVTAYNYGKMCRCGTCMPCRVYRLVNRIERRFGTVFNLLG